MARRYKKEMKNIVMRIAKLWRDWFILICAIEKLIKLVKIYLIGYVHFLFCPMNISATQHLKIPWPSQLYSFTYNLT